MRFFTTFHKSFTDLDSYSTFVQEPMKSSFGFILKWYALLAFSLGLVIFAMTQTLSQRIAQAFPEQTILEYNNGSLEAKQGTLPLEISLYESKVTLEKEQLILTVGTESSQPTKYADLFPEGTSATIDRGVVQSSSVQILQFAAVFAVPSLFIALFVSRLITIALYSLGLVAIDALFRGRAPSFKKTFQYGLHAAVPAELVELLALLLYRSLPIPFFDLVFLLIMMLVRNRRAQIA